MLPFVSLDAVGSTGAGESHDFETAVRDMTMIATCTGSPDSAVVQLQGSHDNESWIGFSSVTLSGVSTVATTTALHWIRYVRANLTTLSGGSSPTVTATILADFADEE